MPLTPGLGMPPGMAMPMGRGPLASPATAQGVPSPEVRTVLASPIGDRLAGPMLNMQQQQAMGQAAASIRRGLQMLASMLKDSDPMKAVKIEKMAADLLMLTPSSHPPPGPQGAMSMMPNAQAGSGPTGQIPPPAVRPQPLSGPAMGPLAVR